VSRRRRSKFGRSRRVRHIPGVMNDTEKLYAERLEADRVAGRIKRWAFEAETLWLSQRLPLKNKCTYTPDFVVWLNDGTKEYHEVKGYLEADAWIKFKWACERYPSNVFVYAETSRGHQWRIRRFGGWLADESA
jgi:hypothetical protein